MRTKFSRTVGPLLIALSLMSACAVNPVTGKREITFVSEASEIKMGEENYAPMQQSQGAQYDVDPALTSYVQGIGAKLVDASKSALVSDRPFEYEFVVLNNSVPNAWALPGGKIAVNRGLLTELNSEAELAAVIGHEIVHAAARHTAQRIERSQLLQVALLGTAVATSDSSYGNIAVGGAGLFSQMLNQSYGRGDELESDKYGMRFMSIAGYDPQGAVALQETFVRLSEGRESDWLSGLFASHPPSQERVKANRQTAAELPAGGELGVDRYKAAMAKTMAAKPAYDLYDEGRKALGEDKPDVAIEKAEGAIALLPEEANFYALRGDARIKQEKYSDAVKDFDDAIRRRNSFFYYYLQRGRLYEELGSNDKAVTDLEKSIDMLPTGPAYFSLGNIAAKRGDKATAISHYRKIAGGSGELAKAAQVELVKLDLENNPDTYLQKRCDANSNGDLVVTIGNGTPVTIAGIRIAIEYTDSVGRQRRVDQQVSGQLAAGKVLSVNTGLGPYTAGAACPVRIVAASVVEKK
ncbi:MAG: M48 family metalloprotease [Gammaproteobacteria bacterium]|nr:M48 family metalloprotease [Gammaproteobacteria bacterium]